MRSRCTTPSRWSSTSRRTRAPSSCSAASPPGAHAWRFNGKVVVAPGAAGTDSQQSLRGLLAGPGAEIDLRPQLEIHTDDVRCSHGATTGKLDDNMLFYLLSRGLEPDTARRLLKWAFLEDAVCAHRGAASCAQQIEQSLAGVAAGRRRSKELL